jgi:SAM-dependent methyltransferase
MQLRQMISIQKRSINKFMKKQLSITKDNDIILDVGSGNERWKKNLDKHELNITYIQLDLDEKRYKSLDIVGNILNLPFHENTFDHLICTEVLEHIFDYKIAIEELFRVLKLNGKLFLTVPFMIGIHDTVDYFRYSKESLTKLFKNDFIIDIVEVRGGIFCVLGELISKIPNYLPVIKSYNIFKMPTLILSYILGNVLSFFDFLDRAKDYNLGYNLLLSKKQKLEFLSVKNIRKEFTIIDILCCPSCRSLNSKFNNIDQNTIECSNCSVKFQIKNDTIYFTGL